MNTEKLHEFLILSKTLNYSKAAKKLFITQSVLSRHIMDMEKELGVKLLERSTHGVILTEAGELLSRSVRSIAEKCDNALTRLRMNGPKAAGTLSIAFSESVLTASLINCIKHFKEKYSEVSLLFDIKTEGSS